MATPPISPRPTMNSAQLARLQQLRNWRAIRRQTAASAARWAAEVAAIGNLAKAPRHRQPPTPSARQLRQIAAELAGIID